MQYPAVHKHDLVHKGDMEAHLKDVSNVDPQPRRFRPSGGRTLAFSEERRAVMEHEEVRAPGLYVSIESLIMQVLERVKEVVARALRRVEEVLDDAGPEEEEPLLLTELRSGRHAE